MAAEILRGVSHADYHADNLPGAPHFSRSVAVTLLQRSPLHAWHQHPMLGAKAEEGSDTSDHGSLFHHLLLGTGPEIAVAPDDYPDWRGKRADFRDEARERGAVPVLAPAYEEAERVADELRWRIQDAGIPLEECEREVTLLWSEGDPLVVAPQPRPAPSGKVRKIPEKLDLMAALKASLEGAPAEVNPPLAPPDLPHQLPGVTVRARADLLLLRLDQRTEHLVIGGELAEINVGPPTPVAASIWDLKFPDPKRKGTPQAFQRSIPFWGYDLQAFLYMRGLAAVFPELAGRVEFNFLWCETWGVCDVAVVPVSASQLAGAAVKWDRAAAAWRSGLETGTWPGYGKLLAIEAPVQQLEGALAGGLSRDERIEALFGEGENGGDGDD